MKRKNKSKITRRITFKESVDRSKHSQIAPTPAKKRSFVSMPIASQFNLTFKNQQFEQIDKMSDRKSDTNRSEQESARSQASSDFMEVWS